MPTAIKKTAAIQDIIATAPDPDMNRRLVAAAAAALGISRDLSHQTAAAAGMNLARPG